MGPWSFDDLRRLLINRLGIQEAAIAIMRTKNKLPRFRDALTFSALFLVLPPLYPAQEADRFQLLPPALQVGRLIDVEPQLGPQPPCGDGPIPPYLQVAGAGLKMKASPFLQAMHRSESMRTGMLHYAHVFFTQVAQSAACNTFHSLDQRCSRWLLMTQDRMESNEFPLTHEFLAMMLGVRRAGVSYAANALRRAGVIEYARGHVTIVDREALVKRSC